MAGMLSVLHILKQFSMVIIASHLSYEVLAALSIFFSLKMVPMQRQKPCVIQLGFKTEIITE